jgi:hypothetical protein
MCLIAAAGFPDINALFVVRDVRPLTALTAMQALTSMQALLTPMQALSAILL